MSLSVQNLARESFIFRRKTARSVHVPGMGEYLVGIDVPRMIGYANNNDGRRATKRHVPQKYVMWFEDVKDTVESHIQLDVSQDDAILLKEPGIYCFLLRCKIPKAEPFMEWVEEAVLPQQVQKLASTIEEKDTTITLLTGDLRALEFTNEKHQQKTLRLNKEIDGLIKNRHVVDILTTCCVSSKRIARRPTHITFFNVNIDSLKNIKNVLNFVTQTWRSLAGVMIQMLFINGKYSKMK